VAHPFAYAADEVTATGRLVVRVARSRDAAIVRALDDAVFPPDHLDLQRAEPGELEAGVAAGDVHLLELGGDPVAYLHADRSERGRVFVSGLAVRPDLQRHGLGTVLVDRFLWSLGDPRALRTPVIAVTSPRNHTMLRVLFARGFVARWVLPDHFGPGRHRLGCQLRSGVDWPPGSGAGWVPTTAVGTLRWLVQTRGLVIRALRPASSAPVFGPVFELAEPASGDLLPCTPP
jgi:GNAT superfamily N-acetyltransferase